MLKSYRFTTLVCFLLTSLTLFSDEEERREDLFLSSPEQVATLTNSFDQLVGGLINPLSGQLALKQIDLVAKGAQDVTLTRVYIPPHIPCAFPQHEDYQEEYNKKRLYLHLQDNYKGWQFYPHLRLELSLDGKKVRFSEPTGTTLDFYLTGTNGQCSLAYQPYAITNTLGDTPGGKYDLRNTRIFYQENGNQITVHTSDGSIRHYYRKGRLCVSSYAYLLEKEILPNGKILKYYYDDAYQLNYVESRDPEEKYVYASIWVTGSPWEGSCHFTSSNGMSADYTYQIRPVHWKIKERVKKGLKIKEERNTVYPPILTNVSSPFYRHETLNYCDRFLLNAYSGKKEAFVPIHTKNGDGAQLFKIQKLLLPSGPSDALVAVHDLSYDPPLAGVKEGKTIVRNSDGASAVYHFSKSLLLNSIEYFGPDGNLKKEKTFTWSPDHWLESVSLKDGNHRLLFKTSFSYDTFGNPTTEVFSGNLTGKGNVESYKIRRVFSQEGRNLLLREDFEGGRSILFTYLPNTNLLTSKLTQADGSILRREFFVYDDCNNLVQKISDDGSSEDKGDLSRVTQRTLTTYLLRQTPPFLHMPEWEIESYLENGSEKILKKTHLSYDSQGNIAQEEVFDEAGKFAYALYKTYNEAGDLLSETNRLGKQASYTYDAKGHKLTETDFSQRLQSTFTYDARGRERTRIEAGEDGTIHKIATDYNAHDRLIQEKDYLENATQYTYDPCTGAVVRTDFPAIASPENTPISVVTSATYDSLGRTLTKTDANGNTTTYHYNAYGSPTEIAHPDGSKETFLYETTGALTAYTGRDGLTIRYKRDPLDRVLSKTYISNEGKTLAEETYTYDSFHLLTETDKENNTTRYAYDGAGRKIREEFCGHVTEFSYDSLGRLAAVTKQNGDNTLVIHYTRDLDGRVLEERKTDPSGHLLYRIRSSYDDAGNCSSLTRFINGQEAIHTFLFDPFHRLIEEKDAAGSITLTRYHENQRNALGQKVLQIESINPAQVSTVTTYDALSQIAKKETVTPDQKTVACTEKIYDPAGNLILQKDHVYENGQFQKTQLLSYTYTPTHQLASSTRAFGTEEARTTSYAYSPSGKAAEKRLPDGICLSYHYHPLGFLSCITSSDEKIHHNFHYNLLGHLLSASDEKEKIAIHRTVDSFGNVLTETFPYGLEVKKEYDDFNRLISLHMGSHGEIRYTYNPLYLRAVERLSSEGKVLYKHEYETYDEDGNLKEECLIANLGEVAHTIGPLGYPTFLTSPYFEQECAYDAAGNLYAMSGDFGKRHFFYDALSQLLGENRTSYAYDSLYNRIDNRRIANNLNELVFCKEERMMYDLCGNQTVKQTATDPLVFTYDSLSRLTEAETKTQKIQFVYDPLGRCLSKAIYVLSDQCLKRTMFEHYLYDGNKEIGAFTPDQQLKNLRVLGHAKDTDFPSPVAIEIEGHIFAPILDAQNNVRRLINADLRISAARFDYTPFGAELNKLWIPAQYNPWRFASMRYEPELGLVCFGSRYYDPEHGRWLNPDLEELSETANPYPYFLNNPFIMK